MEASPQPAAQKPSKKKKIVTVISGFAVVAALVGGAYWYENQKYVSSDKAILSAPLIKLAPHAPGALKHVYVDQGDLLHANTAVARVRDEMIYADVGGTAVIVQKDLGTVYQPGQPVVTMIEPKELRVVAQVQEDEGLRDIHVGQRALFTVDAFGGRKFEGTVESVSQTNHEGDVVFNISDQRQENNFDVKIQYDHDQYPELQNGMSAKVWIVK